MRDGTHSARVADAPVRVRVAQCVHGLGIGGAQQVIRYIAKCGDRSRYEYLVYAPNDGVLRADIEAAGATVRIIPRVVPKLDPVWVVRLAAAMRRDGVQLVHTHLFGDSLHGFLAAKLAGGIPTVMTLHSVAHNFTPTQLRAYRWLIHSVDRAIACSPSSFATFSAAAGAESVLSMVANGLSLNGTRAPEPEEVAAARAGLGIPAGAPVIGAVGRLVEAKGYSYLVSAVKLLRESCGKDVRLVLVGAGPLRDELERQARREGVGDAVVLAGFRSDTAVLLRAFDVVAFSSLREGIPLALLEALAVGRCVVATAVPSLIDVLDERNSLLVPARDPRALAGALERVLTNPKLRRELGEAGRRRFLESYTAEEMTKKYEAVYAELLLGGAAQRRSRRAAERTSGRAPSHTRE